MLAGYGGQHVWDDLYPWIFESARLRRLGVANNLGAVFKITPAGTESVLYSFKGGSDGAFPAGNLILDASGNLYGVTYYGGNGQPNCAGLKQARSRGGPLVFPAGPDDPANG